MYLVTKLYFPKRINVKNAQFITMYKLRPRSMFTHQGTPPEVSPRLMQKINQLKQDVYFQRCDVCVLLCLVKEFL